MTAWYERLCGMAVTHFSWLAGDLDAFRRKARGNVSDAFIDALNFTGLELEPYEVLLCSYAGALVAALAGLLIDVAIFAMYGFSLGAVGGLTLVLLVAVTLGLPLAALQFLSEYPKSLARHMKVHSLGDIPEVLSYIVMYLKLVPNMEDGLRFAARESHTSLGRDMRKLIWDLEIRVYHSVDDAVTAFADMWGKWSDYLKRALHLVRSAVRENSQDARNMTLNRSLSLVMEGTRSSMTSFAQQLHQPTLVIYSIGVMIPLALIAMMPAASLVGLRLSLVQIFLLYDILLPLALFAYIRKVLRSRPATFNPPSIPDDHPAVENVNKRANLATAVGIGAAIALPGVVFMLLPVFSFEGTLLSFLAKPASQGGLNEYFPVTLFILWGVAAAVGIYCLGTYRPYKKTRDEIKAMEREFADSLYVIGKRITEGKPAEDAFQYASQTLKGSKMGSIFARTAFNLTAIRTNLREALFDDEYGSLKHVYSDRIRAVMRLFVEGVQKSHEAAGNAIVKIAEHLKQLQDVEKGIKQSLGTLTSTLRSTATLFAPMIAGVTLGITKLISVVLGNIDLSGMPEDTPMGALSGISGVSFDVRPEYFVLVIGIYVIELIFLLVRFANGIDEGDDRVEYLYGLGQALPTAVAFFSIVTILAMALFGKMA